MQAQFLETIINNEYPEECKPWLHDSHLIAIPKTPTKPRPIGMRSIDQRTATHFVLSPLYVELRGIFDNIQFGIDRLGTEKIIHSIRHLMERDKKMDVFLMDGENAFNSLSRIELLLQIKEQFPDSFNFFHSYLSMIGNMWFMNKDSPISSISSKEGVVQGDVAGSSLYSLAIHPLAVAVREILLSGNDKKNCGLNFLYIDDHSIVAHFQKMKLAIAKVLEDGPKYGYNLNKEKGTYLMSECENIEEATMRRSELIDLGLNPSIIKIHPNNLRSNNSSNSFDDTYYGAKILGSYIGSDSYIKKQLKNKLTELNEQKLQLINNVENYQNRLLLLRECYSWKINHLFRTLPPSITNNMAQKFGNFQKDVLKSILFFDPDFTDIPSNAWLQSQLQYDDAGLNIQNVNLVKVSAYVASTTQCLSIIISNLNYLMTEDIDIRDIFTSQSLSNSNSISCLLKNQFSQYYDCLDEIKRCDSKIDHQYFVTTLLNDKKIQKTITDILYQDFYQINIKIIKEHEEHMNNISGYDISRMANYVTSIGEENSFAFKVAPKFSTYKIPNNYYQSMLLRRLLLPQPFIPANTTCTCGTHSFIDQYGIHASSCLLGGDKKQTSKNIEHILMYIANYAGCRTKLQQTVTSNNNSSANNNNNSTNNNAAGSEKSNSVVRTDLTVFQPPQYPNQKLQIDATVVQSYPGSNNPLSKEHLLQRLPNKFCSRLLTNRNDNCREAHRAELAKNNKNGPLCAENNDEFLAFVMETNGYINYEGLKFLKSLAKKASAIRSIPEENLMKYFKTLLSVTLQRSISEQIVSHTARISTPFYNPSAIDRTYQNIMSYDNNFSYNKYYN